VLRASGKCLDIAAAGTANGTNIQQWTCNGTPAQRFELQKLTANSYRLVDALARKCVDVNRSGAVDGTNIQLWACNGSGAQSFRIEDVGNGYSQLVNTNSNKCVDVAGSQLADGTNVQLWTCNGTGAQAWKFVAGSGDPNGSGGSSGTGGSGSNSGGSAGSSGSSGSGAGTSSGPLTNRAFSIPVGIENVNDSPLKAANYRALLRFVPDSNISIDRFYFGFKLRGASCWDSGNAGYGAGDGGTLEGSIVNIDAKTGLPTTTLVTETINACTRHKEASVELGSVPVMVWVNTKVNLEGGRLYAFVVRNAHADPTRNFFSFNMPLADTLLAGPHARNELNKNASGGILGLDPREHVAWSVDGGKSWRYGSGNGQYNSFMNDHDSAHPATRMPQYGFRLTSGMTLGMQPYYAYSTDCTGCSVTYANARYARTFSEVGGFTASGNNVGTLTFTNTSTGMKSSCTPAQGYGFRKCSLPTPVSVAVGQSYSVSCSGSVEVMELDNPQRLAFPRVGTTTGEIRTFQQSPASGTNAKDVPNLWAGPVSANFPAPGDN
jgi:hypothetical protein